MVAEALGRKRIGAAHEAHDGRGDEVKNVHGENRTEHAGAFYLAELARGNAILNRLAAGALQGKEVRLADGAKVSGGLAGVAGAGEFLHLGKDNSFIGHAIPRSVSFTQWHVLAVDWLVSHITFWLDGKPMWTVQRKTGSNNFVPSTPFHLALQNDAGCANHKCRPNKSTSPRVVMQVDWVRIYAAPAGAR